MRPPDTPGVGNRPERMDPNATPWWETLPAILTASTTALGALVAAALTAWRRIRPVWLAWQADRRCETFFGDQELFRIKLRTWRRALGANRGILIVARNCGWTDPTQQVLVSIVTESEDDDSPTVYDAFQKWPADGAYKSLLHDVHQLAGKPVLLVATEMSQGRLRDHYRHQGTVASLVFLLGFTPEGGMLFVSFNFGDPRLSLSHPKSPWGTDAASPSAEWTEQAEPFVAAARKAKADPERIAAFRREAHRVWFGR